MSGTKGVEAGHPASFEELRRQLTQRLAALTNRVGAVQRDLRIQHDDDWVERATEIENEPVLEQIEDATRVEVGLILGALDRIDNGTYGHCAVCGGDIDAERLRAVPTAIACRRCAAERSAV